MSDPTTQPPAMTLEQFQQFMSGFDRTNFLVARRVDPDLKAEGYDLTNRYAHRKEHALGATEDRPFMHLKIVPNNPHGKTHHLKSARHTSQVTRQDFLANFEKVTGDDYRPSETPEQELARMKEAASVAEAKAVADENKKVADQEAANLKSDAGKKGK
jgi:hypothetical protein